MRGLNVFAWVSAFVVAFLIVVFVVFSIIIANVLETDPIKIPSEVEALAAVFALIFGTAAVAGGAIATIKVASLGIEIYERQEYLEKTQFVETRVKPSIDRYSNLVLALSDTHAAAIALREYIKGWVPKLDNTGKKYDENQDLPPMLLMSVETFTQRLNELSGAIRDIISHEFTHHSFKESVKKMKGPSEEERSEEGQSKNPFQLDRINNSNLTQTFDSDIALSVEKLSDIKGIIDIAVGRLRMNRIESLAEAISRIILMRNGTFGIKLSHNNVETFMFMGLLIHREDNINLNGSQGSWYIAQLGAAIIHDLIKAIPDGSKIKESFQCRYEEIIGEWTTREIEFEPEQQISPTLTNAVKGADSIGEASMRDLYLLEEERRIDR